MAHETIWIKDGKSELARMKPGSHVITANGRLITKQGDIVLKEDGELFVVREVDAGDLNDVYNAGGRKKKGKSK